jgi:hypothetical protein
MIKLREKQIINIFSKHDYTKINLAYSITKNQQEKKVTTEPEKYFQSLLKIEKLEDKEVEKLIIKKQKEKEVEIIIENTEEIVDEINTKEEFYKIVTNLTSEELSLVKKTFFIEEIE